MMRDLNIPNPQLMKSEQHSKVYIIFIVKDFLKNSVRPRRCFVRLRQKLKQIISS